MKTLLNSLAVLIFLLVTLSPRQAGASTNVYQFKREGAQADLFSVDASGCVTTWIWLFTGTEIYRNPRTVDFADAEVLIYISRKDSCKNIEFGGYANQSIPSSDLKIDGGLNHANLKTTVRLVNQDTQEVIPLSIDVTWAGMSPIHSESSHFRYSFADTHINRKANHDFRYARVTGILSDGITNYITQTAAGEARIFNAKEGEISISPE
jgi:hypothetical protein